MRNVWNRLKKYRGYWIFLLAALVCFTLQSRRQSDWFDATYSAEDFYTRYLTEFSGSDTQPLAFVSKADGGVAVHCLQKGAISLKAGQYDVGLMYAGADEHTVLKIYSSDYISPDNTGGTILVEQVLAPADVYVKTAFTLDQDVNSVYITVETVAEEFSIDYMLLASWDAVCTDTTFYIVLTILCALLLFFAANFSFSSVQGSVLGGKTISSRRIVWVCLLVCGLSAFIASIPLLNSGLIIGHDSPFQLARIEGIASGLASGQFPVRVHGETLNGFGYPNSYFYPELLLYIPAGLSLLGVQTVTCYKFYLIFINLLTAVLAYSSFKKLFRSRSLGLALAVVYVLNPYRLICIYYRAAIGEMTAMTFFPLVLYGLYAIFLGDQNDWTYLVWGATGVLQSHILSTELIAFACLAIGLVFIRSLFGRDKRWVRLVRAGVYTVLLNVWFLVPMLVMSISIRPIVYTRTQSPIGFAKYTLSYLFASGTLTDIGPHMLGWAALFTIGFYILYRAITAKTQSNKTVLTFADTLLAIVLVCAIATTAYFPWEWITKIPVVGKLLDTIQFPYRLLSVVAVAVTALAGYTIFLWLQKRNHRIFAGVVISCLVVVSACVLFEAALMTETSYPTKFYYSNNMNNSLSVGQYEYLASGAQIEDIVDTSPIITGDNPTLTVTDYQHKGTTMRFNYSLDMAQGAENEIVLPLTYIPKYEILVDGQPVKALKTENCRVAFVAPSASGTVTVRYCEPSVFRLFELCSAVGLLVLLVRKKIVEILLCKLPKHADRMRQYLC